MNPVNKEGIDPIRTQAAGVVSPSISIPANQPQTPLIPASGSFPGRSDVNTGLAQTSPVAPLPFPVSQPSSIIEQSLDSTYQLPRTTPKGKLPGLSLVNPKIFTLVILPLVAAGAAILAFSLLTGEDRSLRSTSSPDQSLLEALADPSDELQDSILRINLDTIVTGDKFIIQDASGNDLLVTDTTNSRIGIGGFPEGEAKLQVLGDIMSTGTLLANGGSTMLSDQGLRIGSVLVCTAAGCIAQSSTTTATTTSTSTETGPINADTLQGNDGSFYRSATNINSGTLDDSRLSSSVTLQGNSFNGALQLVQTTITGDLPVLDGSNLTNVNAATLGGQAGNYYTNASNLSTGTLSDSRLSTNVSLLGPSIDSTEITNDSITDADINSAAAIAYSKLSLTGSILNADLAGSITDSKLSTISSAGKVADTALSTNVTLQGNSFNGVNQLVKLDASGNLPALNASALTSLNASNISSGTVADARLSGNVALLNASQTFTAAQGINVSSATAFQVQNAGTVLLLANTSTGQISFPNATSTSTAILIGGDATLYRSAANVLATTSTFLGARLTTAQRDAIPNGQRPTGAMIFNTTTNTYEYNAGSEVSPNWLPFRRQVVYTLAQWPPANPYQGQVVVLADTYNGKSFKWVLTYRPDLSATYPWDADTNNAYVVGQIASQDNLSAYTHTYNSIWDVPLAGDYQAIGWWQGIAGSPTDSGTRIVCLGPTKSSAVASASTCTTPAGAAAFWSLATSHDSPLAVNGLTSGQTIQSDRYNEPGNTTTTQSHGFGLGIKPRRLSN